MLLIAKKYMSQTVKVQDYCLYIACTVFSVLLTVFLVLLDLMNAAIDYFLNYVPLHFVTAAHPNASQAGLGHADATTVEKALCALRIWLFVC